VTTVTEQGVLDRVAAQEPGAMRACTERYGGLVWSLASRMCPSRVDAEDAMQDVFLEVWKSAARFDETQGSEVTFVATIARRRLIDRLRKQGRVPGETALVENTALPLGGGGPEEGLEVSEDASRARKALGRLSGEQQRVIQMAVFHGASHEKISASTGMPLGTVKAHIRRGMIRLREILAESGSGGGIEMGATP
jgi:RNA polymerase sigma factor (sigma-70 family)